MARWRPGEGGTHQRRRQTKILFFSWWDKLDAVTISHFFTRLQSTYRVMASSFIMTVAVLVWPIYGWQPSLLCHVWLSHKDCHQLTITGVSSYPLTYVWDMIELSRLFRNYCTLHALESFCWGGRRGLLWIVEFFFSMYDNHQLCLQYVHMYHTVYVVLWGSNSLTLGILYSARVRDLHACMHS